MTITLRLSEEVEAALRAGGPVVALETTLVSHGFPGEQGVQVALAAEARVRQAGAVPATIGIVDGTAPACRTRASAARATCTPCSPGKPCDTSVCLLYTSDAADE